MQNNQTAQQAQNPQPQTAVIPRELAENAADALWQSHRFIQAAKTVALTIHHLSEEGSLIRKQAELLIDQYEHLRHYNEHISFDLFEALEESE